MMDFNPFKKRISELNKLSPKKGRVLVSEPFMQDEHFKRSVVLLTEYGEEGIVGFILNQPLKIKLNEILDEFPDFDAPVFLGGPVQAQNLFYLHNRNDIIDDGIEIMEGLYWNGDFEKVKKAIENKDISSNEIKFFLGYSGWDFDQLKDELDVNSWFIQNINAKQVLSLKTKKLWKEVLSNADEEVSLMAKFPENPSLN